jgi:hypothetical protein
MQSAEIQRARIGAMSFLHASAFLKACRNVTHSSLVAKQAELFALRSRIPPPTSATNAGRMND